MNSASLCSLAARYNNFLPPRFLATIDCLKIPALRSLIRSMLDRIRGLILKLYEIVTSLLKIDRIRILLTNMDRIQNMLLKLDQIHADPEFLIGTVPYINKIILLTELQTDPLSIFSGCLHNAHSVEACRCLFCYYKQRLEKFRI
jgi:hypothetical protein